MPEHVRTLHVIRCMQLENVRALHVCRQCACVQKCMRVSARLYLQQAEEQA